MALPVLLFLGIIARSGAILAPAQRSLLTSRGKAREGFDEDPGHVKLIVNHLPKCGGLFIQDVLKDNIQGIQMEREQDALQMTEWNPTEAHFVIGMIRNPLQYYISHWSFLSTSIAEAGTPGDYLKSNYPGVLGNCSQPGCILGKTAEEKAAFRRFVRTVSNETLGQLSLRFWGSYMGRPPNFGFQRIPVVNDYIEQEAHPLVKMNKGTLGDRGYEIIMAAMDDFTGLEKVPVDCWIQNENLNEDMTRCVKEYEKIAGPGTVNWQGIFHKINSPSTVENTSPHAECKEMYDEETLRLVTESDKKLFDAFGYPLTCPT